MRTAIALSLCLLGTACFPYARYGGGGYHEQQYVMRDAVFPDGQRLLLREDRGSGELVIAEPRELSGELVVVDPDRAPQGDLLVVRPAPGQARRETGRRHARW